MSSDDGLDSRIFVGGLDQDCDESALDKAFSMFGEISQITIMRDRDTQHSRGFGFISFDNPDAAEDAIQRMHGVEVMGRCVTVRKAANKQVYADRGGFRGRGRSSFRGRGGGDRYESRGRGSFRGRRYSNEGYSRGYNSNRGSRGSYNSRRGDYSRSNYRQDDSRSGGYDDRRGGNDNSRQSGYGNSRMSPDIDAMDRSRGSDRYSSNRREYDNGRYADSRKNSYRSYDEGPPPSRESYSSNNRYESATRGRSRSPIVRYVTREESPVQISRDYSMSPVRRPTVREYSPMPDDRMSKGYSKQETKHVYREYSPQQSRSRAPPTRDLSPDDFPVQRGRGRPSSPPLPTSRMREMSPDDYVQSRSRGRAGSPGDRRAYVSSRSAGAPGKPSMSSRKDYSSGRSQEYSSRDGRYPGSSSSSRDYQHRDAAPSRSSGGMDRGSGSRSYGGPPSEIPSKSARYMASREDSYSPPPPPQSSRPSRDPMIRGMKRASRRSPSPDRRERRY